MSKLYKGKIQNLMPQITLKQLKKEKTEIPHPKNNKLKIYKSVRPFGKDVTNIKQNYPMIPISSFNPNGSKSAFCQILLVKRACSNASLA